MSSAQSMHRVAKGMASSRAAPIGLPHDLQLPYSPASRRASASLTWLSSSAASSSSPSLTSETSHSCALEFRPSSTFVTLGRLGRLQPVGQFLLLGEQLGLDSGMVGHRSLSFIADQERRCQPNVSHRLAHWVLKGPVTLLVVEVAVFPVLGAGDVGVDHQPSIRHLEDGKTVDEIRSVVFTPLFQAAALALALASQPSLTNLRRCSSVSKRKITSYF